MNKKTIEDIDVYGKKVLLRVDYNVPLKDGVITDDTRITESLPTIKYLLEHGASVILCSHLGRPEGEFVKKYSLYPVAKHLGELLGIKVKFAKDVIGDDACKKCESLKMGEVLLLENLRFEKGEEANDTDFARKLASFADVYVCDAFGTSHRKHASTYGVALLMPSAIGFLIEKELNAIVGIISNPKHPFVAVLGGAKVSDKIGIVNSLLDKVDTLIIGGAMAYTFLKALGYNMGSSLVDEENIATALSCLDKAAKNNVEILLPFDHVIAHGIEDKKGDVTKGANIPDDYMGVDIGPKTIKRYKKAIRKAKSLVWNGPMGVFENEAFAQGTFKVAKAVAKCHGYTIVGGGDSVAAVAKANVTKKINHISTGGGASLKLFEGKVLAGVDAISNKETL
ncbi:MAG: phosphoglycerate kinase [Clostridia bacterium]|nr:phosphoglycerate kinase [Clostridia bacterium]